MSEERAIQATSVHSAQAVAAAPAAWHREVFAPTDAAMMMSQAPWWSVSLVIHGILLLVLAMMNVCPPAHKPKMIVIEGRFVDVQEPEKADPSVSIDPPSDEVLQSSREQEIKDDFINAAKDVPVIRVAAARDIRLDHLFPGDLDLEFEPGKGAGNPLADIPAASPTRLPEVIDILAHEILEEIQRHDLLVVLLFDESKSLVEDRKVMVRQVRKTINDLKAEMRPRERARLKWAMVSYSEKPTMWLQPTSDLDKVVLAADTVETNTTGKENMVQAVDFTMKNLGALRKRMFIVLVTDEQGDDVHNTEELNRVLNAMVAAKTRFFVFGREAGFQLARVREWLRDEHGERLGPWGYADRGLESCRQEFFPADWFWNAQHSYNGVPAGFGCWAQCMLAHQTGGTYFILSDVPMKYEEDLMEQYKPEWEPVDVYARRTESSRVRKTLAEVFAGCQAIHPTHWLTHLERIKSQTKTESKKARDLLQFVDRAIDELEPLKSRSRHEKHATKRWEANYDLAMAQLYKLKFMAREYVHVTSQALRKGFPKPKKRRKFNLFAVTHDSQATDAASGRRGNREMAKAREMFAQVVDKHRGTPWADVAAQQLKRTTPLTMRPAFHIEPTRPEL